jgi:hypothetical protein
MARVFESRVRRPHRKPWETLLIGYIGHAAHVPPLPRRLVVCSVPLALHSAKPPLDALLAPHAAALLAAAGAPPSAHADDDPRRSAPQSTGGAGAWRQLRKLELFAREVRPYWVALGDESLHFQHAAFFEAPPS